MLLPLCLDPKGQLHLTPADHCPLLGTLGPKADGSCSLPQKGSILLNLSWARSVWKTMSLLYPSCGPLHWHESGYPVSLPLELGYVDSLSCWMFPQLGQLPCSAPGGRHTPSFSHLTEGKGSLLPGVAGKWRKGAMHCARHYPAFRKKWHWAWHR